MIVTDEQFEYALDETLSGLKALLMERRGSHGNSIYDPVGIFSSDSWRDKIRALVDLKLERVKNHRTEDSLNDSINDLMGYLTLYKVGEVFEAQANDRPETAVVTPIRGIDGKRS